MSNDLLKTYRDAEQKGVAVGHFNVSDLTTLKGVVDAAKELQVPVIIGASEGERQFLGDHQLAATRSMNVLVVICALPYLHRLRRLKKICKAARRVGHVPVVEQLVRLALTEQYQP